MKKSKVIIALICAVACFLTTSFVPSVKAIANSAEYPSVLTEIYPADFGIEDGVYTAAHHYIYKKGSRLVGTIFTADIKHRGPETLINYASTGGWDGLVFHLRENTIGMWDSSKTMYTESFVMDESTAGVKFSGETYRLQISIEACDSDNDGETDDAKVGVFFNYNLYNNEYFYLKDAAAKLSNHIVIRTNHAGAANGPSILAISSPIKQNSENYLKITPGDFGVLDGEHNNTEKDVNVGLDGKNFSGNFLLQNVGDYVDYNGIKLEANALGGLTLSDSTGNNNFPSEDFYTDISDLTVITPESFGLSYGTHTATTYGGRYVGANLENTYFTTKVKFSCNGVVPTICYGGADIWTGLQINFSENLITVRDTLTYHQAYKITPADIGFNSFKVNDMSFGFDLGISVRYGDYDKDGVKDDLQYGIFISGKLIHNKYAYVYDFVDENGATEIGGKFGRYCLIYAPTADLTNEAGETVNVQSSIKVTTATTYPPSKTEDFDLEIITRQKDTDADTLKDDLEAVIYIDNTVYKTLSITDYKSKLSGKLKLKGSVKSEAKTISYTDDALTFGDLGLNSNKISASSSVGIGDNKVISGNVGYKDGSEYNLSLSIIKGSLSVVDLGIEEGNYTSSKNAVGIASSNLADCAFSLNMKITNATAIYYAGKTAGTGIRFNFASTGLSIYNGSTSVGNASAKNALGKSSMFNTEFLFGITMNIADTDSDGSKDDILLGVWFNDNFYKSYKITGAAESLGGYVKIVPSSSTTATIKNVVGEFPTEEGAVLPAAPETIELLSLKTKVLNGALKLSGNSNSTVTPEKEDSFAFDLWLVPFSLDDDKEKNDLIVTVYIDGKQLDSRAFFIKDIEVKALTLGIDAVDITFSDRLPEDSLKSTLYSLYNGEFLLAGTGDIIINRESGHKFGEKINTVGEYTIIRELHGEKYAKKVELWRAGYVNADSKINILDFVATMRYIEGIDSATYIKKGADLDFDGSVTAVDVVKVKKLVLGVETPPETALTDKWSFSEDVMPIIGFYAPTTPYIEAYSNNLTPNVCTDEVYQLISDLGINFLSYIEAYFSGAGDKKANLKNLEMASKYGIGALVTRNDVNDGWNEHQYTAQLSYMAHFPSFEGMVVCDEPHGSSYPDYEDGNTIDNFIKRHEFTRYANMFGYTNLLPYVKGWAGNGSSTNISKDPDNDEVYMNYMREFCEKMKPKSLCWDSYPLGSSSSDFTYYYKNLKAGRQVAKEYNIPFWAFLQTFSRDGEHNTKEEMLWNINTMLAFGLKGVQYYYLVQPHWDANVSGAGEVYDFNYSGLIGANGQKTVYYDHALAVNKQIMAVDHVLMNSDSEKILAIGEKAQSETGIYDDSYGVLTSATATADRGAIIGCFDYRGKQAFYVSSNSLNEAQTVKLTFDKSHSLELISSSINNTVEASEYTLNLTAGEGVLIVVD